MHLIVTSKNESWPRLIWPITLYILQKLHGLAKIGSLVLAIKYCFNLNSFNVLLSFLL